MQHYNRLSFAGDVRRGTIHAGQSVGLVHDIPDVAEIIRRIVVEAQETMTQTPLNRNRCDEYRGRVQDLRATER